MYRDGDGQVGLDGRSSKDPLYDAMSESMIEWHWRHRDERRPVIRFIGFLVSSSLHFHDGILRPYVRASSESVSFVSFLTEEG